MDIWDRRRRRRIRIRLDDGPSGSGFLLLFLLLLLMPFIIALFFTSGGIHVSHHVSQKPQPFLATDSPAGFYYNGIPTTALAGYYCIDSVNSSNGYSIQLNVVLNNGMWVVNRYLKAPNGQTGFYINYIGT